MQDDKLKLSPQEEEFFQKVAIPYDRDKEEIWEAMRDRLGDPAGDQEESPIRQLTWWMYAVAAGLALLVLSTLFMRFHTKTIVVKPGEYMVHALPDGSVVTLNADSRLSYAPYWWFVDRSLLFEGEGFFEVEKGSDFSVVSGQGTTEVLGTSFNIYTRDQRYRVYCVRGKVRVTDNQSDEEVVLHPAMYAEISDRILVSGNREEAEVLAWRDGNFNFGTQSLDEALDEIERHYGIRIQRDFGEDFIADYSGSFKRPDSAEVALEIVCQSLGLDLIKLDSDTYKISEK